MQEQRVKDNLHEGDEQNGGSEEGRHEHSDELHNLYGKPDIV